jgi:hypothetical protein
MMGKKYQSCPAAAVTCYRVPAFLDTQVQSVSPLVARSGRHQFAPNVQLPDQVIVVDQNSVCIHSDTWA